jgi:hypothetical protein
VVDSKFTKVAQIEIDNDIFYIDDDAPSQGAPMTLIGNSFHGSTEWKALLGYALKMAYEGTSGDVDTLILGLPFSQYNQKRADEVNKIKAKTGFRFHINNEEHKFNIKDIILLPQGAGAIIPYLKKEENVGIVDIGYYTLDLAYFTKGQLSQPKSMSENFGVHELYQRIIRFIKDEYSFEISIAGADSLIRTNKIKISGNIIDLTDKLSGVKSAFTKELFNKLKSVWENQLMEADNIIFIGGGTEILKEYFNKENNFTVAESAAFANVKGFYEYAVQYGK